MHIYSDEWVSVYPSVELPGHPPFQFAAIKAQRLKLAIFHVRHDFLVPLWMPIATSQNYLEEADEVRKLFSAPAHPVVDLQTQRGSLHRFPVVPIPLLKGFDGHLDPDRVPQPRPGKLLHRFGLGCREKACRRREL